MTAELTLPPPPAAPPVRRSRSKRVVALIGTLLVVYLALAYLLLPAIWKRYVRGHPALEDIPGVTHTGAGIPGDPLNVVLVGTETQLKKIMLAAGWDPADGLTFRSCLAIAVDTVLKRPDP